jgi:hypothetical protein
MREPTAAEIADHIQRLDAERVTLLKRLRRLYRNVERATAEYRQLEDRAVRARALLRWKQLEQS